jgi:hypothetical protein
MEANTKVVMEKGIQSTRTVLVEKSNSFLIACLNQLTRVSLFSSTVIPLPNKKFLVYQESKKAAYYIFGRANIVIARVVILENIITNSSALNTLPDFNLNSNININMFSGAVLFVNGAQFSMSMLVAIPSSSKEEFIKSCMRCKELNFHHQDVDNPKESYMEHFPVWKIPCMFSGEGLRLGKFMEEFDIKKYPYGSGKTLQNSKKADISLFHSWVSFYDKGLWNLVTNKTQDTNKTFNKLS